MTRERSRKSLRVHIYLSKEKLNITENDKKELEAPILAPIEEEQEDAQEQIDMGEDE